MKLPLLPLILLAAALAYSQSTPAPAPNAAGVSWQHVHLIVRNVDAERTFWTAIGAQPGGRGVVLGGTNISLTQGESNGGSDGTAIDHVAYRVKDLAGTLARVAPAGGKILAGATASVAFVSSPEAVKVELISDPSLATAVLQDHVHLTVPSASETQAWFAKALGAEVNAAGDILIPGVVLKITAGKAAPTSKGHSLDHIGFSVSNIAEICDKLEAMGVTHDPALNPASKSRRSLTYISSPTGIYMELLGGM
jgi:catechol 2,3-dioxygenase-like lactoylglutathione lyase family enzyme